MSNIKELASITYDNIFHNNSHYFNTNIENIKEYILSNQKMLTNQLDKFLFISELKEKLGADKVELIIEQEKKYGQILVANYKEICELYFWLVDIVEKHYEQDKTEDINTFIWSIDNNKINNLYNAMVDSFIDAKTNIRCFIELFSGKQLTEPNSKIIWLKYSKNKHLSKKSISDFIDVLIDKKIIALPKGFKQAHLLKILDAYFCSNTNKEIKFETSNLVSRNNHSEFRFDLEDIVTTLLR
ncbi:MAG: hypothetical protein IPK18_03475 [Sphingobacteriales bacterium]|nr:MAG: hypothetical protein IPK18_03475 [Sphingobacteriales bacterium]